MGDRGFLHLIIHGARGLPAADFNVVKKPSSDPYCVATLAGQRRRTQTIRETLNPVWEQAFSFQLGSFLPPSLLAVVGLKAVSFESEGQQLDFKIFDEDQYTQDDPLGHCSISLPKLLERPFTWVQRSEEVDIEGGFFVSRKGHLSYSVFWEPAPLLQPYVLHMASVICTATAFALLLLAANCRWEHGPPEYGALKQPGVGAAATLGSGVLLLALILQFLLIHMETDMDLDDLAASNNANKNLRLHSDGDGASNPILRAHLRAAKLMEYEISVTPAVDLFHHLHLPMVVLAWLLPAGGFCLALVSLALQVLQTGTLQPQAGQICAYATLGSIGSSYYAAYMAHAGPNSLRRQRARGLAAHKQKTDITSQAIRNAAQPGRRRDYVRASMYRMLGSRRDPSPHTD